MKNKNYIETIFSGAAALTSVPGGDLQTSLCDLTESREISAPSAIRGITARLNVNSGGWGGIRVAGYTAVSGGALVFQ